MASPNTRRNKEARTDDLYTTPFDAVHDIAKREQLTGSILDAGCGTGNITEVIKQYNPDVTAIDLHNHGYGSTGIDFLNLSVNYKNVVSNPPFTILNDFILKALQIASSKVIIFCRVTALETAKRYSTIYQDTPPSRIYFYVSRINCSKGGLASKDSSSVFYCWLVWDKEEPGKDTICKWIDNRKFK